MSHASVQASGQQKCSNLLPKLDLSTTSPTSLWTTAFPAPSIGLLLCRTQNKMIAEYALRGMDRPLGVSTYQLAESLPPELKGQLPSVEELEKEMEKLGGGERGE